MTRVRAIGLGIVAVAAVVTGVLLSPPRDAEAARETTIHVIVPGLTPAGAAPAPLTLRASLAAHGRMLPGKNVTFSSGGRSVCADLTDADGIAECTTMSYRIVRASVTAIFAGTDDYDRSSDTLTLR